MGRGVKTRKIVLGNYGSYLKMEKGCFVVKDAKGKERTYPALEKDLGEITVAEGNVLTSGALVYCGLWSIDVVVTTRFGEPIAMLKNFVDDSYVKTRINQYESLKNEKSIEIARQFLIGKIKGQNLILKKYGLEQNHNVVSIIENLSEDNLLRMRKKLLGIEGKYGTHYFKEVHTLFPKKIRPLSRISYHAYVGLNNVFNLAYTFLKWKCYRAVVKAHLEPYLGFLHSHLRPTRPNLICDFMELYRHMIDDFLIQNCKKLSRKDFHPKTVIIGNRKAKRMFLKDDIASRLADKLHDYFMLKVKIPRIRVGKKQELETLINEEAFLLAKFLRNERKEWIPRIAVP